MQPSHGKLRNDAVQVQRQGQPPDAGLPPAHGHHERLVGHDLQRARAVAALEHLKLAGLATPSARAHRQNPLQSFFLLQEDQESKERTRARKKKEKIQEDDEDRGEEDEGIGEDEEEHEQEDEEQVEA